MSGLKELCELVSGLNFLEPDDLSPFQPRLDHRAVKPPAGFRRHSTSLVSQGRCQSLAPGDGPCSLGLSRCLSHGDSPEGFGKPPSALPQQQQQQPSPRYKTELCRPFQETGVCRYGDKCQFAHGLGELRFLSRHPKYKTELCRTFHSCGVCPYGSRCHFIHSPEEERVTRPPPQLLARPRLRQSTSFSGFSSSERLCPGLGYPPSLSPPPCSSDLPDWDSLRAAVSQEFARVMKLTCSNCQKDLRPPPQAEHSFRSAYADSLSDQEDYSSSGSESPIFDQNRRLPIFSRISVSDD